MYIGHFVLSIRILYIFISKVINDLSNENIYF